VEYLVPTEGCKSISWGSSVYAADARGHVTVDDPARGKVLRDACELTPASAMGTATRTAGYRCPACSFGSWFRRCSRCDAVCVREG